MNLDLRGEDVAMHPNPSYPDWTVEETEQHPRTPSICSSATTGWWRWAALNLTKLWALVEGALVFTSLTELLWESSELWGSINCPSDLVLMETPSQQPSYPVLEQTLRQNKDFFGLGWWDYGRFYMLYHWNLFFFLNGVLDALLPSDIENQALEPVCLKSH